MFDDFKVVNYPKSLPSPEAYARHMSRMFTGDIIDGFTVTPGTGLQVVLAPGNAMIRYGSNAVASARMVSLVNNFSLAIDVADVSNPRIDLVVLYVDNAVDLPGGTPTAANLDGKGVAKAKIVKGTAAAVPAKPNATAIQASVGAGNPYSVVAEVRVDAGVTVIAANKITDSRVLTRVQGEKIGLALSEWIDTGASNPAISGTALTDVPGVSTTYTNSRSVPMRICVSIDFMALGVGGTVGLFFTINANGVDGPQRFTSLPAAIWSSLSRDFYFTIPAGETVPIKARYRLGPSQTANWGRDSSDPGYRTRLVIREISAA